MLIYPGRTYRYRNTVGRLVSLALGFSPRLALGISVGLTLDEALGTGALGLDFGEAVGNPHGDAVGKVSACRSYSSSVTMLHASPNSLLSFLTASSIIVFNSAPV